MTRSVVALLCGAAIVTACKDGRPRVEATTGSAADASTPPAPAPLPQAAPTWWNRIAALFETHCTSCHAEGGIGPFALTTFADAREHVGAIGEQVRERRMPPWLPDGPACAPLLHSRALAQEDVDAVTRWIADGAPEGDRADHRPPLRRRSYAAVAGAPDRVAAPDAPYAPKRARNDDYHCFVLDPKLVDPQQITALRIVPGAAAIVHHVLLFEVRGPAIARVRELDDRDAGPGYTCFGGIGVVPTIRAGKIDKGEIVDFDAQMIVGWAPGGGATDDPGAPTALPEGTAIHLASGSRLVLQVHYSLDNWRKGMTDETRVEMWFSRGEARRQAVWIPLLRYDFRVPPGVGPDDPRATAKNDVDLPLPLTILGVAPHMHLRGRSIRVEGAAFGAPPQCLLDVPRWDFHHQEAYWLKEGVRVSRATVSCTWDNRRERQPFVNGKQRPARELRWGEGTDDEMCLAFLYATL